MGATFGDFRINFCAYRNQIRDAPPPPLSLFLFHPSFDMGFISDDEHACARARVGYRFNSVVARFDVDFAKGNPSRFVYRRSSDIATTRFVSQVLLLYHLHFFCHLDSHLRNFLRNFF